MQGQGSEGEQSEHAVRACDCVSTLEQLPPGRKGSKWPGKQTPSVLFLGHTFCWSSNQLHLPLARGQACVCVGVWGGANDQGFHRGHYPVGTPQSGRHKDQKARTQAMEC